MCDIYSLFSDSELMQRMVRKGAEKARAVARANADFLIGTAEAAPSPLASNKVKPMHPCFMAPPGNAANDPLLLFDLIDIDNTVELQYGTLICLAIDKGELEKVASASFPLAAEFARSIPLLVQKSLLGTRNSPSQIPVEFVVKFVILLTNIYHR